MRSDPNSAGNVAERHIAEALRSQGVHFERRARLAATSIYDTKITVDFLLTNLPRYPDGLIVEMKWQDVPGSVDEKFPYLVQNVKKRYPYPTIIVVGGGGCRPAALRWLRSRADGQQLIGVHSLEEFLSWVNRVDKSNVLLALPLG